MPGAAGPDTGKSPVVSPRSRGGGSNLAPTVTTATKRPAGRSGAPRPKGRATPPSRSKRGSPTKKRAPTKGRGSGRSGAGGDRGGLLGSMGAVAAGHATDLWGIGLVTLGVLWASPCTPVHSGRRAAAPGSLRAICSGGVGSCVPLILVAVGIRMLMGRGDDRDDARGTSDRPRREPARAVIGGTLFLLAVAGLAALAGGSPALKASTHELSAAGGWLGAAIANPLGHALGGPGTAMVLLVVVGVAVLVFTGVSVRTAASGLVRAVRWLAAAARGDRAADRGRPRRRADRPLRSGPRARVVSRRWPRSHPRWTRRTTPRRRMPPTSPLDHLADALEPVVPPEVATKARQGRAARDAHGRPGGGLATPTRQAAQAGQGPGHRRVGGRSGRRRPGQRPVGPRGRDPPGGPHRGAYRSPGTNWSSGPGSRSPA